MYSGGYKSSHKRGEKATDFQPNIHSNGQKTMQRVSKTKEDTLGLDERVIPNVDERQTMMNRKQQESRLTNE